MSTLEQHGEQVFADTYDEASHGEHAVVADDLRSILKLIAAQIEDSNQRHVEVLTQMQDRLQDLETEARRTKSRVPEAFAPAFERIQDGIALLAERIAEAGAAQTTGLVPLDEAAPLPALSKERPDSGTEPSIEPADNVADDDVAAASFPSEDPAWMDNDEPSFDAGEPANGDDPVSEDEEPDAFDLAEQPSFDDEPYDALSSSRPGDPENPWDDASAEALTRVIEDDRGMFRTDTSPLSLSMVAPMSANSKNIEPALERAELSQPEAVCDAVSANETIVANEREWLQERFADIAERIEVALTEMRPDDQLHALGDRFERLQEQIGQSMESVVKRSDLDGLRGAETQIEDLIASFQQLEQQSGRLDVIEVQLQKLMQRFSDENLMQLMADAGIGAGAIAAEPAAQPDFDALANAAAETVAARFADLQGAGNGVETADLRDMIQSLMDERRQGDEQTAGTLDTIQQAMISVLDRVEAIEQLARGDEVMDAPSDMPSGFAAPGGFASQHAQPNGIDDDADHLPIAQSPTMHDPYNMETGLDRDPAPANQSDDLPPIMAQADADPELTSTGPEARANHQHLDEPTPGVVAPDLPQINAVDRIRQEFIADAQRARLKAEQDIDDEATRVPGMMKKRAKPSRSAATSEHKPKSGFKIPGLGIQLAGSKVEELNAHSAGVDAALSGAPEPQTKERKSLFAITRRKLLVGAFVLLIATSGLLLLSPRKSTPPASQPAAVEQTFEDGMGVPEGITPPVGFQQQGQPNGASDDAPFFEGPAEPGSGEDGLGDRSEVIDGPVPALSNPALGLPPLASNGSGSLAGVSVQPVNRRLDADKLARLQERQWMAHQSSKVGAAAAKATPASLLPEYQLARPGTTNEPVSHSGMSRALDLPPATVGPLSLRLAAAKGDPSAEFEVGARMAEGRGMQQDLKEAVRWYKRSASQGFAQSQYRLGTLYERGLGVKQDNATARVWYQRAAEGGNVKAMHNLAVLSASRAEGSPDYLTAAHWFGQAAERGLADSQYNLAVLYENGLGVSKDTAQAYKFYALAAGSGDSEATKRRDAIKASLSARDLLDASRKVTKWRNKPVDKVVNDARAAGEAWKARDNGSFSS